MNKSTNNLISNADIDLDSNTKMLLASSLYFKGEWLFTFPTTQQTEFHLSDSESVPVETMSIQKRFVYGAIDNMNATWASIPYNSTESLVIILPNKDNDIDELIQEMSGSDLTELVSLISGTPLLGWLNITLPKFKLDSRVSLVEPLKSVSFFII